MRPEQAQASLQVIQGCLPAVHGPLLNSGHPPGNPYARARLAIKAVTDTWTDLLGLPDQLVAADTALEVSLSRAR